MADMKTAMQQALQVNQQIAKLRKPLMERVWIWIKDHPDRDVARIASELRESRADVSSSCSQLTRRGMVERMEQPSGMAHGRKTTWVYRVHPKMRGVYELLPLPKSEAKPAKVVEPVAPPVAEPSNETPQPTQASLSSTDKGLDRLIEELTIKDARRLYQKLGKLFGDSHV